MFVSYLERGGESCFTSRMGTVFSSICMRSHQVETVGCRDSTSDDVCCLHFWLTPFRTKTPLCNSLRAGRWISLNEREKMKLPHVSSCMVEYECFLTSHPQFEHELWTDNYESNGFRCERHPRTCDVNLFVRWSLKELLS